MALNTGTVNSQYVLFKNTDDVTILKGAPIYLDTSNLELTFDTSYFAKANIIPLLDANYFTAHPFDNVCLGLSVKDVRVGGFGRAMCYGFFERARYILQSRTIPRGETAYSAWGLQWSRQPGGILVPETRLNIQALRFNSPEPLGGAYSFAIAQTLPEQAARLVGVDPAETYVTGYVKTFIRCV